MRQMFDFAQTNFLKKEKTSNQKVCLNRVLQPYLYYTTYARPAKSGRGRIYSRGI